MSEMNTDKLLEDLHTVIRDAEELLRATAGQAGEHIAQTRARAEATLQSARSLLSSLGDAAAARARRAARAADACVQGNPWVAVGAGAAVGLLAGLLMARRPGRTE
jgi:ElaB/YqjD/DUF883 family membrane-anchored ribosome-binding protein